MTGKQRPPRVAGGGQSIPVGPAPSQPLRGFSINSLAAKLVRFCPGCGSESLSYNPDLIDNSEQLHNPVFDVLCTHCSWSGDVSPDISLDIEVRA